MNLIPFETFFSHLTAGDVLFGNFIDIKIHRFVVLHKSVDSVLTVCIKTYKIESHQSNNSNHYHRIDSSSYSDVDHDSVISCKQIYLIKKDKIKPHYEVPHKSNFRCCTKLSPFIFDQIIDKILQNEDFIEEEYLERLKQIRPFNI